VSSFADRQLALVKRLRGIEARLNALQAQFGDVSLDLAAATGDAAACKELAAAETETVRLVRERPARPLSIRRKPASYGSLMGGH
jgi:transcription elongation GreA/GreB family factor